VDKKSHPLIYRPPEKTSEAFTIKLPSQNQEDWEKSVINYMTEEGWIIDKNDETTIGFSRQDGIHKYIKDFNKKTRRFVCYDGNLLRYMRIKKNDI